MRTRSAPIRASSARTSAGSTTSTEAPKRASSRAALSAEWARISAATSPSGAAPPSESRVPNAARQDAREPGVGVHEDADRRPAFVERVDDRLPRLGEVEAGGPVDRAVGGRRPNAPGSPGRCAGPRRCRRPGTRRGPWPRARAGAPCARSRTGHAPCSRARPGRRRRPRRGAPPGAAAVGPRRGPSSTDRARPPTPRPRRRRASVAGSARTSLRSAAFTSGVALEAGPATRNRVWASAAVRPLRSVRPPPRSAHPPPRPRWE